MGDDSPINDATITYTSPAQPAGTGVFLPAAGTYALGGPTCFRGVVTFRVEHPAYVAQEVTVTITRDVAGGSDQACRSNPPLEPLVVRLVARAGL